MPGIFDVTLTAQTAYGVASGSIYIDALPPRITSQLYLGGVEIGTAYVYQIQ